MYNKLSDFIEKHRFIYKYQFGFRKKHSVFIAMITWFESITSALDNLEFPYVFCFHPKLSNSTCGGGEGLIGRPAVFRGRCNKCHSLQLQNHYVHIPPLQHHIFMQNTTMRNWSWEIIMGFEALYAGRGRRNPVWSGKEAHWSLRGLIVKSAEHCGADYKLLDK